MFQIARGSGATLSECTFFFKKAHVTKKTSSRQTTSRSHDKKNPDLAISELFLIKNPVICSGTLQQRIRVNSKEDPPAPYAKKQEARGLHPNGSTFFLQKGIHHAKISRSATRFRSRKHPDDACSCLARPERIRQGFQSSTMKCSGACRCGTHGIPRKEGRRSSLTRILSK